MKMEVFTPANCKPLYGSGRTPGSFPAQLSVNYGIGLCNLSLNGQIRLGVKDGHKVQIAKGEDGEIYIRKTGDKEEGFPLRKPGAKAGKTAISILVFNSRQAVQKCFSKPAPPAAGKKQRARLVYLIVPEPLPGAEKWFKLVRKAV